MATLNEEIGKLIARRLLAGEAVQLPEVGSLYTKRIAARRLSRQLVEPPHRRVEFTDSPMGHSLIEEIAREAHCTPELAADAYERWRAKATCEGRVIIDGVGTLCLKSLSPTPEFEARLNPQGHTPIRVKRRPMPWWAWTLITLTLIAALFGLLAYFVNPLEVWERLKPATTPTEEVTAAPTEPMKEAAIEPASQMKPIEPKVNMEPTEQTIEEPQTEPKQTEPSTEQPKEGTIMPTRAAHSYVVLGIYSTEANARRAVELAQKRYGIPASDFTLWRYDEKFLVSLGETELRAEAQEVARRYRTQYGVTEVWVYSKVKR